MSAKRYQNYVEEEVLEASPLKLTLILYRATLDAIQSARRYLRLGEILPRSRQINKAIGLIAELSHSLDFERGGELSRNLERLYTYTRGLLIRANCEQKEEPLEEAEQLLNTLLEGWTACAPQQPATRSEPDPRERPEGYYCAPGYESAMRQEC